MSQTYIDRSVLDRDIKKLLNDVRDDCVSNPGGTIQADVDAMEATIITDLGVLRTAIIAIATAVDAIATKVNASQTNCATNLAAGAGTPAAISTV
jgi:hypothetical protein